MKRKKNIAGWFFFTSHLDMWEEKNANANQQAHDLREQS